MKSLDHPAEARLTFTTVLRTGETAERSFSPNQESGGKKSMDFLQDKFPSSFGICKRDLYCFFGFFFSSSAEGEGVEVEKDDRKRDCSKKWENALSKE